MRVFATLMVLALAACAPKNTSKAASAAAFSSLKWSDLSGAPFTLTTLSVKVKTISLPSARLPTIQFGEKNAVSGLAGVNRYSVEGAVSGKDGISWSGPMAVTKMAGPPEAMALESQFLQALQSVTKIELQGAKLKLSSADGATHLEMTR